MDKFREANAWIKAGGKKKGNYLLGDVKRSGQTGREEPRFHGSPKNRGEGRRARRALKREPLLYYYYLSSLFKLWADAYV